MSPITLDFSPAPLDTFDVRHAAESHARAVCQALIVDDERSAASIEANLEAAIHLIVGSLLTHQPGADVVMLLRRLAKQITRDGTVIQRGRIISLD